MLNNKDIKAIAEIINKHHTHIYFLGGMRAVSDYFIMELADYFEKEARRICPCGAYLDTCSHAPKLEKTKLEFDRKQFLKECGVE